MRPYLVVLQSDFLRAVETVIVAPLAPMDRGKFIVRLTPMIDLGGKQYLIMIHEMGAVPRSMLKRTAGSAMLQRDEIASALDFLFSGF